MNDEEVLAAIAAVETARQAMKAMHKEHGPLGINDHLRLLLPKTGRDNNEYAWGMAKALFSQPSLQQLCLAVTAMAAPREELASTPTETLLHIANIVIEGAAFGAAAFASIAGIDEAYADAFLIKLAKHTEGHRDA